MAFSFSGEKSEISDTTNVSETAVTAKVLTMEDDLKTIASEGSINTNQISVKQNISDVSRSSSQTPNPFQTQETEKIIPAPPRPEMKIEAMQTPPKPPIKTLNTPEIFSQEVQPVALQKGKMLMMVGIIVIALAIIGGGVYYYLFVVKNKTVAEEKKQPAPLKIDPETEVVVKKELPYAIDKPNYLPLNVEVVSATDIYNTFTIIASRIKENAFVDPVEFLITDQNNTPLALSRFVFLTKMNINTALLATLDESFSLFMYNDGGNMRIGLRLVIKNQGGFTQALTTSENVLPLAFQPLLLGNEVKDMPKSFVFKSSVFVNENPSTQMKREYPLRYTNISVEQKLSIDYAVVDNKWYIGTSQNTLRTLLQTNEK